MKKIIAAGFAVASLAFASGAFAQAKPLTLDTPIQDIVAVPEGKAVLDKDLPGLTSHPAYEQFKSMSLKDVQPMSQGALSDEALKKAGDDLAAIKPK